MALLSLFVSCNDVKKDQFKVWAWLSGRTTMSEEQLEQYFSEAARVGIDAIILECHGGRPEVIGDSASFRDDAAIIILENAVVYAKKYGIELHAWMWTTNRVELSLRKAHPEWYQVNAQGKSCADIKLYNREHYRFLCPTRPEVTEYLKDRVREIAQVEGLTGIHMDFIRYPDAILPYGLHESRGVVQDKVYPLWDFCYCDECRAAFKEQTGVDPMDIEDPTSDQAWMQFRYDRMSEMASEIAREIKACGKVASAAVFASPYESRKLVRQDWPNFRNLDYIFPMIYHKFYDVEDEWVELATREGVEALRAAGNEAVLCSGLFVGHVPAERIEEFIGYTENGGSDGICFFSMEGMLSREGYTDSLKRAVEAIRLSD
ncbi:MAG: family 10 glycosylhydrolase [Bacteroidales bacterium]|nr:family 10 glycosylhydrolase [Bacteroidales bacterium]